jgi:hypothetical protein
MSLLADVLREECTQETVDAWVRSVETELDVADDNPALSRRHYTYILVRGTRPFYVGLGRAGRWKEHWQLLARERNLYKKRIITNLIADGIPKERCVIKAKSNLTRGQAGVLEAALIAAIGRHPYGPLTNLSAGGEASAFGFRWTDEQKAAYTRRKWITDGILSCQIEPDAVVPDGWYPGRTLTEENLLAIAASGTTFDKNPELRAKAQTALDLVIAATPPQIWITDGVVNRKVDAAAPTILDGWSLGHTLSSEGRAINASAAKLHMTPERAAKQARAAWTNPESRAALIASRQGQMWITNGSENTRQAVGLPIPPGWWQGKTVIRAVPKRWITNEVENRQLDVTEPIPDGWRLGRCNGKRGPCRPKVSPMIPSFSSPVP